MAICRYFRIRIAYRIDFWSVASHIFPHLVNKQYDLPGDTDISNSAWAKLLFQQTHAIQNQNCAVNRALSVHTRTNRSPSVVAAGQKSMARSTQRLLANSLGKRRLVQTFKGKVGPEEIRSSCNVFPVFAKVLG